MIRSYSVHPSPAPAVSTVSTVSTVPLSATPLPFSHVLPESCRDLADLVTSPLQSLQVAWDLVVHKGAVEMPQQQKGGSCSKGQTWAAPKTRKRWYIWTLLERNEQEKHRKTYLRLDWYWLHLIPRLNCYGGVEVELRWSLQGYFITCHPQCIHSTSDGKSSNPGRFSEQWTQWTT